MAGHLSFILQFESAVVWPSFRCRRLLARCQEKGADLEAVAVTTLYFVLLDKVLDRTQHDRLAALLNATPTRVPPATETDWLVTPRLGTSSSWGARATQMLRHCGFEQTHRIEAVKHFHLRWRRLPDAPTQVRAAEQLHDPMTESIVMADFNQEQLFAPAATPRTPTPIPLLQCGIPALVDACEALQIHLAPSDLDYLAKTFNGLQRDPTEVELMTFAQVNSEHCRHRTFHAPWTDQGGEPLPASLFDLIRRTWEATDGAGVLVAYSDNAAVLEGVAVERLDVRPGLRQYRYQNEQVPYVIKVETHNHPTAISPFPGAATGAGGEIRDEGAVGRGSKPKAGLTGFTLSHLRLLPHDPQPWEADAPAPPAHLASPLQIILEGPIGAAAYNNEFGRPNVLGYFRTFEQSLRQGANAADRTRGYHKPVMLAGGIGSVRPEHIKAPPAQQGDLFIVLGGPAMLVGLGGGTASSQVTGSDHVARDFASVQRANPEMQRRCQEVIDRCTALGERNPIQRIHDVGAGGLSNAMSELIHEGGTGGRIDLSAVPVAQSGLSPAEIWCNESQERYVLRVDAAALWDFSQICRRERCPFAVLGQTTSDEQIKVVTTKSSDSDTAVCLDMPLAALFGEIPLPERQYHQVPLEAVPLPETPPPLAQSAAWVLSFPAVAAKMFLITIGDRTVTGLVARDQLVGPWQMPVADVAVTLRGFRTLAGEAMALGERPQLALLNAGAASRMALAEALTNLAAAPVAQPADVKVSANWMAAADHPGEAARLRDAVVALSDFCVALGISIPVGKDSLSMQVQWQDEATQLHQIAAPVTLNITAFAAVNDATATLTPELKAQSPSHLVFLDLANGQQRLGGSVYAQVQQALGTPDDCPDVVSHTRLQALFKLLDCARGQLLAYHDRSDGGLLTTLAEMAFAGGCGLRIELPKAVDPAAWLFNEELGAVVQVADAHLADFLQQAADLQVQATCIGQPTSAPAIVFTQGEQIILEAQRTDWLKHWWSVSHQIQRLRDHPKSADAELAAVLDTTPGLNTKLTFDPEARISAPRSGPRPKVAVLREQGVNGQIEMAAAFCEAGFMPIDVHMTDLASGRASLDDHQALVLCGGFSYGDVLGAGVGWARSILYNESLKAMFQDWFERSDRLTLGVCNGAQALSELRTLIPGTDHWPRFLRNQSEQFEARLSLVRIAPNAPAAFCRGMEGSVLPIAVAHGEGRAHFPTPADARQLPADLIALQYTDHAHRVTEDYPYNPNGSTQGIAGLATASGRLMAMMPHPERLFRTVQHSWHPPEWGKTGPWLRLFRNACDWLNEA